MQQLTPEQIAANLIRTAMREIRELKGLTAAYQLDDFESRLNAHVACHPGHYRWIANHHPRQAIREKAQEWLDTVKPGNFFSLEESSL